MKRNKINTNILYNGDSAKLLAVAALFPDKSIDLIVTSPPYADKRKKSYDGVHTDKYVAWFLPIAKELYRVLKDDGSFILNIKEHPQNGERGTYVLELILELKKQGWFWIEEYCWYKKNSFPGKWPNRFRDSWERCLHFTKDKEFKISDSMEKAVWEASQEAESGDIVLLSPGAASFGLFSNEFDRGDKFRQAVKNLK